MVVAADRKDVDPKVWTPAHGALIKAAAQDPQVQRIFVNPAIKKALCREAGTDRAWLSKVRPWWGHDYHFHVRIRCPADSPDCKGQPAPAGRRRLRQRDELLVHRCGPASEALAAARQAAAADPDVRPAAGLSRGAAGALRARSATRFASSRRAC